MPDLAEAAVERFENTGRRLVIVLLAAGALLLAIVVAAAAQATLRITQSNRAVEHTLEVQAAINSVAARTERIETARRGLLIQPDPAFIAVLRASSAEFDDTLARLARLVADNPAQIARIDRIAALGAERDAILENIVAAPAAAAAQARAADFSAERGVLITRQTRALLRSMTDAETGLLASRNHSKLASLSEFYAIGGIAIGLLVVMMVAAIGVVMRYNRQLSAAQLRLRTANEGLEDAVAARTTELSRANAEIQRFAYIVSHDLRSPLVNVLGFTSELDAARKTLHGYLTRLYDERPELKDQAAWLAVEEDLPEALGFIRTSTEKMDRLINSILELSRQGRRQLRPEQLDMTDLAETVAATMKQRADAAGATIALAPLPTIESDRIAVEQILANLVENALKYLSPKRAGEVRVEGRQAGRWVEIDVIDNGRGIAPADHERIFDLFRRAGTQDQAGEGIGLANVRALAYRLGGRISVESQLDEGARFTLTLPENFIAPEPQA